MARRIKRVNVRAEGMQAFSHGITGAQARQAAELAVAQLPSNGERCAPGEFQRIVWAAIAAVTKRKAERKRAL